MQLACRAIDASDVFQGHAPATPLDGDEVIPEGQWRLAGQFDILNELAADLGKALGSGIGDDVFRLWR